MKKIVNGFLLAAFFLVVACGLTLPQKAEAHLVLKQPQTQTVASKKRCEKCKRGPDGKMECEEVECPD